MYVCFCIICVCVCVCVCELYIWYTCSIEENIVNNVRLKGLITVCMGEHLGLWC